MITGELEQITCDPNFVDFCVDEQQLSEIEAVRPDVGHLGWLQVLYFAQTFSPAISLYLAHLANLVVSSSHNDFGLEIVFWIFSVGASGIFYIIPELAGIWYLIFGTGGDFLSSTIESWVSNTTPILIILDALTMWLLSGTDSNHPHSLSEDFNTAHLVSFIFQAFQRFFYWDRIMRFSPDAIRYIDPTWDEVPSGSYLWPTWFS